MTETVNSLRKSDFHLVCRICLTQKNEMLPIFNSELLLMLHSFTTVKVTENDGLPTSICNDCSKNIYSSFDFKCLCEESDRLLHQILESESNNSNLISNVQNVDHFIFTNSDKEDEILTNEHLIPDKYDTNFQDSANEDESNTLSDSQETTLIINEDEDCVKSENKLYKNRKKSLKQLVECKTCNKVLKSQKHYERHLKTHSNKKNNTCEICGKIFAEKSKLIRHQIVHNPNNIPCLICGKTFSYDFTLREHQKRYHEGQLVKHACTVCNKEFVNIKKHMLTHTRDPSIKPFKCLYCPKTFLLKVTLNHHILMKHTANPPPATKLCSVCGKRCHSTGELKKHMTRHSDVRAYVCTSCGAAFKLRSSLNFHVRSRHAGVRPHVCSVCSKAFHSATHLRRHEKIHTGVKPYECVVCNRKFSQSTGLKTHLKIH